MHCRMLVAFLTSICYMPSTAPQVVITKNGSRRFQMGLPRWLSGKESFCQCRKRGFDPWLGKLPWRRKWQPTPVFLLGKPHEQSSLAGYSQWGHKESDMTEQLSSCSHTHKHTHGILGPPPGMEPMSPALAGKFLTAGPSGKSFQIFFITQNRNSVTIRQ